MLGVLTPIIAFACIIEATVLAPSFSWTNNALSDLGVMPGTTSILFNTGLIISGVLAAIFATGLYIAFKNSVLGQVGAITFLVCALALMSIGVFTENVKPIHLYVSVAFFALSPISMLILTAHFFLSTKRREAVFTLAVASFAAIAWIMEFTIKYVPGVAIPETLSALAASSWSVVLGFKMTNNNLECEKLST
jgi:hypothetical membrane protein